MSKKTKRPAKAGNYVSAAQIGAHMNKATASLKNKIKEAKAAAKEQETAPYGKDFHAFRVDPDTGKKWSPESKTPLNRCEWVLAVPPTGKHWSSAAKWENDPKAVGLSEGWLFVTGARIGSPRIQRLPHLWTQCRRANPKGLPYIAPEQPKTFKVEDREEYNPKTDPKVNRPSNSTLKYRLGDVWDAVEALNG